MEGHLRGLGPPLESFEEVHHKSWIRTKSKRKSRRLQIRSLAI
jgi:hypothetical protein